MEGFPQPPAPLGHSLETTVASGIGGLFGCGTSFIALLIIIALSVALNAYLLKAIIGMWRDGIKTLKEATSDKDD